MYKTVVLGFRVAFVSDGGCAGFILLGGTGINGFDVGDVEQFDGFGYAAAAAIGMPLFIIHYLYLSILVHF
jgi:hypothetical protein